jgi:hypothetical protein
VEFIGKNNGNQDLNYLYIPPEDRRNEKVISSPSSVKIN